MNCIIRVILQGPFTAISFTFIQELLVTEAS